MEYGTRAGNLPQCVYAINNFRKVLFLVQISELENETLNNRYDQQSPTKQLRTYLWESDMANEVEEYVDVI